MDQQEWDRAAANETSARSIPAPIAERGPAREEWVRGMAAAVMELADDVVKDDRIQVSDRCLTMVRARVRNQG